MFEILLPFLPAFGAAYAIQAVSVASPGPAVALLLGMALSQGRAAAVAGALGIAVGAAGLALATTQGLAIVMEQVAWLSAVIRMAGAGYLFWLAFHSFRRAAVPPAVSVAPAKTGGGVVRAFWTGMFLQLTNPKAIVFWLAIATVGATHDAPLGVVAVFVAGAFLISLGGHGAYAVALSSRPFRLAYDRGRRWVELAIGGCLTWFAFRMAVDR